MNNADLIASRLHDAGVREAYGIPGGEVLSLVKGLNDAGIRFVLCKQENAGGFMAEGAHHATGAPGVLVATLGPGVANAVNVIANAQQDRVPVIFLTGCIDPAEAASYTHQIFDHGTVLKSVCKASFVLADGAVDSLIDKAVAIALDDPPGPVHVDVPISLAAAVQTSRLPSRRVRPARGGGNDSPEFERARRWLEQAERPLLIAGMEILNQECESALQNFVLETKIPLITTYKAKGLLPEDHGLCLGAAGLSPKADKVLLPLIAASDCIILAGYDPIEMRAAWRNPWSAKQRVIEFSSLPNTHYMHQASLSFTGDIGAWLDALANSAPATELWPSGEVDATKQSLARHFGPDREEWGAHAVIDVARKCLPRDTVATVDTGAHRILLNHKWHCYTPRTLIQSTGLCTMGCALPMAIGYKRNAPDVPVAAFMGDACLEMVLGEMVTLRDSQHPVILFVFVDASLSLIELKQRAVGYENVGVDFPATDFAAVANALGGVGVDVGSRADLAREINDALGRDHYTLIACHIGRKAYDGAF